jgi:hypothetical protein
LKYRKFIRKDIDFINPIYYPTFEPATHMTQNAAFEQKKLKSLESKENADFIVEVPIDKDTNTEKPTQIDAQTTPTSNKNICINNSDGMLL